MSFAELVRSRRSVRYFRPDPVADDVLKRIVEAACMAPSARDEQPWCLHVTRGETRRELGRIVAQTTGYLAEYVDVLGEDGLDKAMRWYSSLGDAPVVVAISAPESESEFESVNRLLSVGTALENLLLATADEGLGACTVTFSHWVRDDMRQPLSLAPDRSIVALVAIGLPAESAPPEPRVIHPDTVEWYD